MIALKAQALPAQALQPWITKAMPGRWWMQAAIWKSSCQMTQTIKEDPTTLGKWFDRGSSSVILDQRLLWLFVLFYLVGHGGGVLSLDQWLSSRKV